MLKSFKQCSTFCQNKKLCIDFGLRKLFSWCKISPFIQNFKKLVPLSPVKRPSRHYQRSAVGKEIEVQTVEKASQITNKISNDVEQSSQPDRAFNAQPDLSNNSKSCSQPSENGTRSERQGTMQNLSGDSTKEQIRKRLQNTEPDSMPIAEISNGITILWEENRTTLDDSPGCKKSKMVCKLL